jgi:hypothetical protein
MFSASAELPLAPVTEHELKAGMAVERVPQDQPRRGQACVHVPAPAAP